MSLLICTDQSEKPGAVGTTVHASLFSPSLAPPSALSTGQASWSTTRPADPDLLWPRFGVIARQALRGQPGAVGK